MATPVVLDRFDERARQYSAERTALYNSANRALPAARAVERDLLLDRLRLQPGLRLCDVGAGGGYLAEGIAGRLEGRCEIFCVENSASFAATIDPRFQVIVCPLGNLDLPDESMDRVACLAGLHHQERKADFFREAWRVLRPGGILALADVLDGSAPARFLNGPVDRYSDLGHDGLFAGPGEFSALMEEAGFEGIEECHEAFCWRFRDDAEMVWFCRSLFRMVKASPEDVERELRRHLALIPNEQGLGLEWSLTYATATKPDRTCTGE